MAITSKTGINISQEFQSGFGPLVNGAYVFPTVQYQEDLDKLWLLGVRYVRIAVQAYNGFQPIIDLQDQAAILAKAKGFHVSYGTANINPSKPSDWIPFLASVPAKAQWCQDHDIDVFMLGNEHDSYGACSFENIVSISRTTNVVTVTTPTVHNLKVGDQVELTGNSVLLFFVTVASVPTTTTFTVNSVGSNGSDTNGSYRYDPKTVIRIIKDLATSLKTTYSITTPLSFSSIQGIQTGTTWAIDFWISAGRGDVDFVDLNVYGVPADQAARLNDFTAPVNRGYAAFTSDHFRVTEWNLFSNNTGDISANIPENKHFFIERLKFLQSKSNLISYEFCYRQRSNLLILRRPYNTDSTDTSAYYREWWWPMIGKRQNRIET